jgi:hypothetical protein
MLLGQLEGAIRLAHITVLSIPSIPNYFNFSKFTVFAMHQRIIFRCIAKSMNIEKLK